MTRGGGGGAGISGPVLVRREGRVKEESRKCRVFVKNKTGREGIGQGEVRVFRNSKDLRRD